MRVPIWFDPAAWCLSCSARRQAIEPDRGHGEPERGVAVELVQEGTRRSGESRMGFRGTRSSRKGSSGRGPGPAGGDVASDASGWKAPRFGRWPLFRSRWRSPVGSWERRLPPKAGAPGERDARQADFVEPAQRSRVRHFSGTAAYLKTVRRAVGPGHEGRRLYLDLAQGAR